MPVHPSIFEKIKSFNDVCRYGAVDDQFKELLNEIRAYNKLNIDDSVLLTNGSDNAPRLILEVFATPESKLLVPVPSYTHFESMLKVCDVKQLDKPYMDYKMSNADLIEFLHAELSKRYDLCYLVNPSMPIGHLLTDTDIQVMLNLYPTTLFVVDNNNPPLKIFY